MNDISSEYFLSLQKISLTNLLFKKKALILHRPNDEVFRIGKTIEKRGLFPNKQGREWTPIMVQPKDKPLLHDESSPC